MSIPRGTTPTVKMSFSESKYPDLDLTTVNHLYVTFEKGQRELTKEDEDLVVEPRRISVYLNQKETLMFGEGDVEVQANWTTPHGRGASNIKTVDLSKNLLDRVVK